MTEPAKHTGPEKPSMDNHSRTIVSYIVVGSVVASLCVMWYCVYCVVISLTRQSPVLTSLVDHLQKEVTSSESNTGSNNTTADQERQRVATAADVAIILEYANADIRAAGVQVAFALMAGFFFATVGILLFVAGATGQTKLSGSLGDSEWRLITGAPGIVAIVIGGVIIGLGVNKNMSRPVRAEVSQAGRASVESREQHVPAPSAEPPTESGGRGHRVEE